ncbi:MAG: fatty-acyl-CoA synthase [Pseudonocardiales bacterium]|jgi:acyl-CoA synthetase (AMP-forming)/AMP-acid ligase II|nr:fatty-acyl-CoA synthase [Pseudonocardiales bacterium]
MLVGDFVRLNAVSRGGDEALVTATRRYTYTEFNTEVNRVASALSGRGIGHGDRVAVLGRNSAEYVFLYYAVAKLGALLVPLNFWYRSGEHEYALGDSKPRIFFVADEFLPTVQDLAATRGLPVVPLPSAADDIGWQAFLDTAITVDEPVVEVNPADPHMILYTSGTTGRPKGALLSHARTTDDAMAMAAALRVRSSDTFINFFPPFHVGNWDHMKMYHLMGGRVVLLAQFEPGTVLRTVVEERVSVLLAVPAMLHELLSHDSFQSTDLSSIRLLYYGAYDPSGLMMRVADHFGAREGKIEMAHTYGLTEGGPFVSICYPHELFDHFGSIGRAMPGVEITLQDDEGNAVKPGDAGEICVRGPVMSGYWNKPEESAAALAGGWLHTGDVAVADAQGFLRIVDRKKDTIRSGGHNVFSKEVENCLLLHEAVQDCAVIGVPDAVYEEKVVAVVVLQPVATASDELAAQLQAYVRKELAGYNAPKEIHFVRALPKNSVGKTLKGELRKQFGSIFDQQAHGGVR